MINSSFQFIVVDFLCVSAVPTSFLHKDLMYDIESVFEKKPIRHMYTCFSLTSSTAVYKYVFIPHTYIIQVNTFRLCTYLLPEMKEMLRYFTFDLLT